MIYRHFVIEEHYSRSDTLARLEEVVREATWDACDALADEIAFRIHKYNPVVPLKEMRDTLASQLMDYWTERQIEHYANLGNAF